MSLVNALWLVAKRDFSLACARPFEVMNPLIFFVIVVTLFPLATSIAPKTLTQLAPSLIWVAVLLATLLSLDRLLRSDYEDGTLEQILLSPYPLAGLILAKIAAHWMLTGLPLLLITPVLASMFAMPFSSLMILEVGLMLGTPTLNLIGAIGAALTVNLRGNGILLTLIVLPLYIPVLIFGTTLVTAELQGLPITANLAILGALLVLAITFVPVICSAALKMTLY